MQRLKFVSRASGKSKAGKDYDIVTLSNGLQAFTATNNIDDEFYEDLEEGDDVNVELHCDVRFGSLIARVNHIEKA